MVTKKKPPKVKDSEFNKALAVFQSQTMARLDIAMKAYNAQDEETQEVLESIRDRIVSYSSGIIKISVGKAGGEWKAFQIDRKLVDANALYMATEILKDLAIFDVRIANYKFPDEIICSECGEIIKRPKKKGGRRGKAN